MIENTKATITHEEDRERAVFKNNEVLIKAVSRKDNHIFVHVLKGKARLRLHLKPDGTYNLQDNTNIRSKKVLLKGKIS